MIHSKAGWLTLREGGLRAGLIVCILELLVRLTHAQTITTTTIDRGTGGSTGEYPSAAIVAGNPAIAYYNFTDSNLMFARNSSADGSGTWTITTVDGTAEVDVGQYASLAVVNGNPAISYYDNTNHVLKFARNSASDGSGSWTITVVDSNGNTGKYNSLLLVSGNPAISYATDTGLRFARNSAADGTGAWAIVPIDGVGATVYDTSLAIISSNPAISYHDNPNNLKFARNSAADGSGTWTVSTVAAPPAGPGQSTSLADVGGLPAITHYDGTLKFYRNSNADGSGTWNVTTVDGSVSGNYASLRVVNGKPAISYYYGGVINPSLGFARNSAADASGTWTLSPIETPALSSDNQMLFVLNGTPAVTYFNGKLRLARNSAADGSGTWSFATVDNGFESGNVGQFNSQRLVNGKPAIAYYDSRNFALKFTTNSASDGTGTWSTSFVETGTQAAPIGAYASLALVSGNPAIAYAGTGALRFARNSAADGSGTWSFSTPENTPGNFISLAVLANGRPALSYQAGNPPHLRFARNSAADGSGTWTATNVDTANFVGQFSSLATVGGKPAVSYLDNSNLKFARNSAADGSGTWTVTTVDSAGAGFSYTSLGTIGGFPAISYYDQANSRLKLARNNAVDGSGTWSVSPIAGTTNGGQFSSLLANGCPLISYYDSAAGDLKLARNGSSDATEPWTLTTIDSLGNVGQYGSLIALSDGRLAISYYDVGEGNLKWATVAFPPDIAIEQPAGTNIVNGTPQNLGIIILGSNTTLTYTLRNFGNADLTGVNVTIDGTNASDFSLITTPTPTVSGPNGSTSFTVKFDPAASHALTPASAALHIASNDPDENPFTMSFTARALSYSDDSDGDGLNDASEYLMRTLGFDWQVSQTSLVNTYYANANGAGLYTTSQVQALNTNVPLIQKNASTGQFKLTLAMKKSSDLINYNPFPFVAGQTIINANGEIEFTFSVPDNAEFFRLESH